MEKITFKNGQAPYINDSNLNQMQNNIEKNINELTNDKVKFKQNIWTDSFDITFEKMGQMGIVIINTSDVYLIWRNADSFSYNKIIGTDGYKVEMSTDAKTLTFSQKDGFQFAITVFYI